MMRLRRREPAMFGSISAGAGGGMTRRRPVISTTPTLGSSDEAMRRYGLRDDFAAAGGRGQMPHHAPRRGRSAHDKRFGRPR